MILQIILRLSDIWNSSPTWENGPEKQKNVSSVTPEENLLTDFNITDLRESFYSKKDHTSSSNYISYGIKCRPFYLTRIIGFFSSFNGFYINSQPTSWVRNISSSNFGSNTASESILVNLTSPAKGTIMVTRNSKTIFPVHADFRTVGHLLHSPLIAKGYTYSSIIPSSPNPVIEDIRNFSLSLLTTEKIFIPTTIDWRPHNYLRSRNHC